MRPGRTHTWHIMRHPGWKGEGVVVVTAKAPRLHTRRSLSVPPPTPPPPLTPPTTTTAYHPAHLRPAPSIDHAQHPHPKTRTPSPCSASARFRVQTRTGRRPGRGESDPGCAPPALRPQTQRHRAPPTPSLPPPSPCSPHRAPLPPSHVPAEDPAWRQPRDHNSRPHPDLSQTASPTHAPPL